MRREPALLAAAVMAAVNVAAAFGLVVTAEQLAAIDVFVAAVLGWWVRQRVTPVQ